MSVTVSGTQTTMHCSRHRAVATSMRCDSCYQPFCRDCLVSRFITSRSSVWLCQACARSGSVYRGAAGPRSGMGRARGGGGVIRHPGASGPFGGRDLRYWLAGAAVGGLILLGAAQQGLLPF